MKTSDGYRFSLQFSANSAEYIRAGDLLEGMKHRKSDFVVRAVCEYLDNHPELEAGAPLRIDVKRELFRRDELEALVRELVQQQVAALPLQRSADSPAPGSADPAVPQEIVDTAVSRMLEGLEFFQ